MQIYEVEVPANFPGQFTGSNLQFGPNITTQEFLSHFFFYFVRFGTDAYNCLTTTNSMIT